MRLDKIWFERWSHGLYAVKNETGTSALVWFLHPFNSAVQCTWVSANADDIQKTDAKRAIHMDWQGAQPSITGPNLDNAFVWVRNLVREVER